MNLLSRKHSKINGAWLDGEDGWAGIFDVFFICLLPFLLFFFFSSPLWWRCFCLLHFVFSLILAMYRFYLFNIVCCSLLKKKRKEKKGLQLETIWKRWIALQIIFCKFWDSFQKTIRSIQRRCSAIKGFLKTFAIFIGKHLCWRLFLIKL